MLKHSLSPWRTVADPGGGGQGAMPPGPVKICNKKDGRQRQQHRFHVSWPPSPHQTLDPLLEEEHAILVHRRGHTMVVNGKNIFMNK